MAEKEDLILEEIRYIRVKLDKLEDEASKELMAHSKDIAFLKKVVYGAISIMLSLNTALIATIIADFIKGN